MFKKRGMIIYAGKDNMEHIHCDSHKEHNCAEVVAEVKPLMPEEEILFDLAEIFKIFGDTTRIKILFCLFEHEMCVCDIAEVLEYSQSAISHQLRVLKNAKLVTSRREGKSIIYSLADGHVRTIIDQGMEHVME